MTRAWKTLFLAAALFAGPAAAEILDQQKIHSLYADGEFEKVIKEIDGFTHRNKAYSHQDSAFIARYLAVVYSANPATREKGKFYMYQLLKIQPEAQLMGMYANEEIEKLFERMKTEYYSGTGLKAPPKDEPRTAAPAAPPKVEQPMSPPPPTPKAAPEKPAAAKELPREKRFRFGAFGLIGVPLGQFASDDTSNGAAALAGLGVGGEFMLRVAPKLYWSSSFSMLLNPFNTDKMEEILNESFAGANFKVEGGHYFNLPLLTGLTFHHQANRFLGILGTAQAGVCASSITELEVTEAGGGRIVSAYEDDAGFAFTLGGGVTLGRHFNVSLRFLNLGKPKFKGERTGEDSSGSPFNPEVFYVSVRENLITLVGGFQF